MEHRQDIQILRGVAVLMVVFFHLQAPFFSNGYLGVDVFFVISGFLMAKLYDKGTILDFYRRRIDRLLPAYALAVVGVVFIAYFLLIPVDFSQLYEQALASIFFVNNFHFWSQITYFSKIAFNPLLNLWSLSVEAQFYLIVPFLYPLVRKNKALLIAAFCITLIACLFVQTISPKTSFFLMPFRIWEFLIGAYVAWHGNSTTVTLAQGSLVKSTFLMLLIISTVAIPLEPESKSFIFGHPSLGALWVVLLTGATIYYGLPKAFENSLCGRMLAKIGDYSYSIYLVHFPIIVLWNYKELGGTILAAADVQTLLAIIATICVASYFSYNFVEKKYSKLFRTGLMRVALLASIFVAATASFNLNASRFSDSDRHIFAASTDRNTFRCGRVFKILHPKRQVCLLGDTQFSDSILLVGNSHADSIKTSFTRIANKKQLNALITVVNENILGPHVDLDAGETVDETKLPKDARAIIDEAKLLSAKYMAIHFSGNIYGAPPYRDQVSELIELAQSAGLKVILIAPIPDYEVNIPQELYLENDIRAFSTDWGRHKAKYLAFWKFSEEMAGYDIPVYDPAETLCPKQGSCLIADDESHPYYYDNEHLTLTGAAKLEPLLLEMFGKL